MAIDVGDVAVILLASGQSRRFGPDDKLLHPFRGEPLVVHPARTLAALPFGAHIAVATSAVADLLPAPFRSVSNPDPARGLSSSIAIGVAALVGQRLKACLVTLGDMPLVPREHFEGLMRAFDAGDPQSMLATCQPGGAPMVPALFGQGRFEALLGLSGDRGARAMLADAPTVACDAGWLLDLDKPSDFGG